MEEEQAQEIQAAKVFKPKRNYYKIIVFVLLAVAIIIALAFIGNQIFQRVYVQGYNYGVDSIITNQTLSGNIFYYSNQSGNWSIQKTNSSELCGSLINSYIQDGYLEVVNKT